MKLLLLGQLLALLALCVASEPCGMVLDGARAEDAEVQASTSSIAATWSSFEDGMERNRVLRYEWAVISEKIITQDIKDGACREHTGFIGAPDVRDWEAVGTRTQASASGLKLREGVSYFVVVRATKALGKQVYANTDGVVIDPSYVEQAEARPRRSSRSVEEAQQAQQVSFTGECAIDAENRCRASAKTVGQFLEEVYGPAEFNRRSQSINLFRTLPPELIESESSEESEGTGVHWGIFVGVALGALALCILLVLVLALVTGISSKSNKFRTNINRNDNMDEF